MNLKQPPMPPDLYFEVNSIYNQTSLYPLFKVSLSREEKSPKSMISLYFS